MPDADRVPVTAELIEAGRSARGGWSAAQLALLGVPWPPPPGWKAAAVGRELSRSDAERFIALCGGPQRPAAPGLFDTLAPPDAEPGAAADPAI